MDTEEKLQVLAEIAHELNARQVVWAVGASLLLYFKGKCREFHDLDLLVAEEDISTAREVFLTLGTLQPPKPDTGQYQTKHFLEFVVEGVEVDVIAGFTILRDGRRHYFPLKQEHIHDWTEVRGERIPLQSLAEWRHYYALMGREEKAAMIDSG